MSLNMELGITILKLYSKINPTATVGRFARYLKGKR